MTSMFGSYLVDFDEIFEPKWSCKDLLFESINFGPLIHDIFLAISVALFPDLRQITMNVKTFRTIAQQWLPV